MKVLKNILYKVTLETVVGDTGININTIQFDSRKIDANDVFIAIRGHVVDGHDYIESALDKGASAVIVEELPNDFRDNVTYLKVSDSSIALAIMASNYYESPSENLKLIGVTGTNGKTTIASLLYELFKKAGYKVGLMSTVKFIK